MDARALYPNGWHPQSFNRDAEGNIIDYIPYSRTQMGGVRYYFIDFGISSQGEDQVLGVDGQIRAPELSDTVPYDPYKLDMFLIGVTYIHLFVRVGLSALSR